MNLTQTHEDPETPELTFEAEMVRPRPTAEAPPSFRVGVRNDTDDVVFLPEGVFQSTITGPLYIGGGYSSHEEDPECWNGWGPSYFGGSPSVFLEPGEWRYDEKAVVNLADTGFVRELIERDEIDTDTDELESCYPSGRYGFQTDYRPHSTMKSEDQSAPIVSDNRTVIDDNDGTMIEKDEEISSFTWGIEITVEN